MALLQYKDPRANILYGSGNSSITSKDIQDYIKQPGMTDKQILEAALANNVSAEQISSAMSPNWDYRPESIDEYISSQGISKQTIPGSSSGSSSSSSSVSMPGSVVAPTPVKATPVTVGANETVAGQFDKLLTDPNNPLAVKARTAGMQYANKRGLLNSDIGAEAAFGATMDRYLPIASQDASTYYDSQKFNSAQGLTADTFNNDQQLRAGMFNSEVQRDLYLNQQNLDRDYFIAGLDADTKTKIANIDAMSRDSGMMGEISRTYMSEVARISSDPNMTTEAKKEAIKNITTIYESSAGIFPSIQKISSGLAAAFNTEPAATGGNTQSETGGGTSTGGSANYDFNSQYTSSNLPDEAVAKRNDGAVVTNSTAPKADGSGYIVRGRFGMRNMDFDSSDYDLQPAEITQVRAFEQATGIKIDLNDVVPEEFINQPYFSIGDAAVPIPVPGSLRGDNIMFNIYASALPKYQ